MKTNNFFAMLSRMKYINRWGLMRNTITENIAEHSLDVSILAHGLAIISNTYFGGNINAERAAVIAAFHDTTEIITGDLPTPIKYYAPEIKDAYKAVENVAANQLISSIPEKMQDSYRSILIKQEGEEDIWRIVKAADKLSALIKCIEEKRMGNKDFEEAQKATYAALVDMHMPEVDFYIKEIIPTYNLTLDEQA